jgi:hypothetical protein
MVNVDMAKQEREDSLAYATETEDAYAAGKVCVLFYHFKIFGVKKLPKL